MTLPAPEQNSSTDAAQDLLFPYPVEAKVPLLHFFRDVPALVRVRPGDLADLIVATWELALANRTLRKQPLNTLGILHHPPVPDGADGPLSSEEHRRIARVSRAFEVIAPRLPWRSDCLVQSLAGRRWLARWGITACIAIGVKRDAAGSKMAHAWLCAGDLVVTGGDIADFAEFPVSKRALR